MYSVIVVKLYIPHSYSLKDKRQVLRSILDKSKKLNISIAETADNETWNYAELTFSAVSNTQRHLDQIMDSVINIIEQDFRVQIVKKTILV